MSKSIEDYSKEDIYTISMISITYELVIIGTMVSIIKSY